jgi:uncharacterized protein HemX
LYVDSRPFLGDVFKRWRRSRRERLDRTSEIAALRKEIAELRAELARLTANQAVQWSAPESSADTAVKMAAERVLNHVRSSGGVVAKSERGLAQLIGQPRSTVRRAVHLLVAGGLLELAVSHHGSVLRVAA